MPLHLDHIMTFANVLNVDNYVERYRMLGFDVTKETRPYKPGLRNRFIQFGCEYLELVWVEDEAAFNAGGHEEFARMFPDLAALHQVARPFGAAFKNPDVETLHREWTKAGYAVPEVWSFAPPEMPPVLSFQTIPDTLLPGVSAFAITYHLNTPASEVRHVRPAVNTVYALEGLTLASETPQKHAARWLALLNPSASVGENKGVYEVAIPPHTAWWMSPQTFQDRYGVEYSSAPHRFGEIAAVHLLAENLTTAASRLGEYAVRQTHPVTNEPLLVVSPIGNDGVTYVIREYPIDQWQAERTQLTGEKIVLHQR